MLTKTGPEFDAVPRATRNYHMPLGVKLGAGALVLLFSAMIASGGMIYYFEGSRLEQDAQDRIAQAVQGMQQMISQSIAHSIQGQLQATADRNLDIVRMYYTQFQTGLLTEEQAKARVAESLLSQKIGQSGYIYIVDSAGTLRVHPKAALVNVNIAKYDFIKEQVRRKTGYLEYMWKNPGEPEERAKALAMRYFEPWDYIISASAYRAEFLSMVDLHSFRDDVLKLRFGRTGYAYIIDTKGVLLIHPELEDRDISDAEDANGRHFIAEMIAQKSGHISYPWKNPGEDRPRNKDVVFRFFPELNIIIAGGIYQDELFEPLVRLRFKLAWILIVVLVVSVPIAFVSGRLYGRPLIHLSELARRIADSDLRVVKDFEQMTASAVRGRTWIGRGTTEIMALLQGFQQAGESIRMLVASLNDKAGRLSGQQDVLKSAASFSSSAVSQQTVMMEKVTSALGALKQAHSQSEGVAADMFQVAEQAVAKVSDGRNAAAEAETAMTVIRSRSDETRVEIAKLKEMTVEIEGMVHLVQEISAHSQILSINAGIQAAKAGEAGRGFAVVASEVRELSVQSTASIGRIKETLQRMQALSHNASRATEESGSAVARGKDSVGKLVSVIATLHQVIDLNRNTADRILGIVALQNKSLAQISAAVEQTANHSKSGAKTADGLLQAVEELQLTQAELSLLVEHYRM